MARRLDRRWSVEFELRDRDTEAATRLEADPTVAWPVPTARLATNAIATFVLVFAGGLIIVASAPWLFGYRPVVAVSGSMEPLVAVGDVVVMGDADTTELAEGTVVEFERGDRSIVHRVVGRIDENYVTAGDANDAPDSEVVAPEMVRGVGILLVPFVGKPALWYDRGQWMHLVSLALVLGAMGYASQGRFVNGDQPQPLGS